MLKLKDRKVLSYLAFAKDMKKVASLHSIIALQKVKVCKGLKIIPLDQSHAKRILEILDRNNSIRDRVSVASRLHKLEDVKREIKKYRKDTGLIRYTIVKGKTPIGLVSLWRDDGFWGEAHLNDYGFGFFLDPNERGNGYITRAVQRLIKVVSQNLYVNQFVAFCEDSNHKSIAVLTRLEFKPTKETFIEPAKGWVERKYIKPANNY